MPIRPIHLPSDLKTIADIIQNGYLYPESSYFLVHRDEQDYLLKITDRLRKIWPILTPGCIVYPPLCKNLYGFIWQENGFPAGLVNFQCSGCSDTWVMVNVVVLPEYRGRGIGSELVAEALKHIRKKNGRRVILDVKSINEPARNLYKKFGFKPYCGQIRMDFKPASLQEIPPLPLHYKAFHTKYLDKQYDYSLDRRIIPTDIQRYMPIRESTYRTDTFVYRILPILRILLGIKEVKFVVMERPSRKVVAISNYTSSREEDTSHMQVNLDPAYASLSRPVTAALLHGSQVQAPGKRTEIRFPTWQPYLLQAAEELGGEITAEYTRMVLTDPA